MPPESQTSESSNLQVGNLIDAKRTLEVTRWCLRVGLQQEKLLERKKKQAEEEVEAFGKALADIQAEIKGMKEIEEKTIGAIASLETIRSFRTSPE